MPSIESQSKPPFSVMPITGRMLSPINGMVKLLLINGGMGNTILCGKGKEYIMASSNKKKHRSIRKPKSLHPNKKKIISLLDAYFSNMARKRAGGLCEICHKAGSQTHHFFPKKMHGAVRFDVRNLIFLCFYDHIIKIHRGGCNEQARDVLIKREGQKAFEALKIEAYKVKKLDLISLYEEFIK
jgi:hypothetical protein